MENSGVKSILIAALVFVPLAAHAQAPKPVEVVNDPLAVEVVNPAPAPLPLRWQLVGFTSATYSGDLGGPFGATQKCQLDFPNSRMCVEDTVKVREVSETTDIPTGLVGVAWVTDYRAASSQPTTGCESWTIGAGNSGHVVNANGTPGSHTCDAEFPIPIACCALVP